MNGNRSSVLRSASGQTISIPVMRARCLVFVWNTLLLHPSTWNLVLRRLRKRLLMAAQTPSMSCRNLLPRRLWISLGHRLHLLTGPRRFFPVLSLPSSFLLLSSRFREKKMLPMVIRVSLQSTKLARRVLASNRLILWPKALLRGRFFYPYVNAKKEPARVPHFTLHISHYVDYLIINIDSSQASCFSRPRRFAVVAAMLERPQSPSLRESLPPVTLS